MYTYTFVHTKIYICAYIHTCVYMCVCAHTCISMCVCCAYTWTSSKRMLHVCCKHFLGDLGTIWDFRLWERPTYWWGEGFLGKSSFTTLELWRPLRLCWGKNRLSLWSTPLPRVNRNPNLNTQGSQAFGGGC